MNDHILESFLTKTYEQATALAAESDLFSIVPVGPKPYQRFIIRYRCKGLVREGDDVREANYFEVGIHMPNDYLRRADPARVITWFGPREVWHPNILARYVCAGRVYPATSLTDLIYQVYEIVSWQKVTMNEFDALNIDACSWARNNPDRFPVDARPLKRRSREFTVETGNVEGAS
jgi:hypothetical protein